MAKRATAETSGFGSIAGMIKDGIVSSIQARIKENFDQAMDLLEARLLVIQQRLLRSLGAALFACTALILLLLAGTFYLLDTIGISRASAFLVLGISFAIVSIAFFFINRE